MNTRSIILSICILVVGFSVARSQNSVSLNSNSKVIVRGTSTIHDWESESGDISGEADLKLENRQLKSIEDLIVRIPVTSIKSGKNLMDKKTYEALDQEEHPVIFFRQTAMKSIGPDSIIVTGNLNIAGETKKVDLGASYSITGSSLVFSGNLPLRLSDFDIVPPTAMMGTIKTGDELVVEYTGVFPLSN